MCGDRVRIEEGEEARVFGKEMPNGYQWLQKLRRWFTRGKTPVYIVVSSRFQVPRCGIGGTYITFRDDKGKEYEIPRCFLEEA